MEGGGRPYSGRQVLQLTLKQLLPKFLAVHESLSWSYTIKLSTAGGGGGWIQGDQSFHPTLIIPIVYCLASLLVFSIIIMASLIREEFEYHQLAILHIWICLHFPHRCPIEMDEGLVGFNQAGSCHAMEDKSRNAVMSGEACYLSKGMSWSKRFFFGHEYHVSPRVVTQWI